MARLFTVKQAWCQLAGARIRREGLGETCSMVRMQDDSSVPQTPSTRGQTLPYSSNSGLSLVIVVVESWFYPSPCP